MRPSRLLLPTLTLCALVACRASGVEASFEKADHAFFELEDMHAAERLYRAIQVDPRCTREERARAHRYVNACIGRRGEHERVVELNREWLALYPDNPRRHSMLYYQGHYLEQLGRTRESRDVWRRVVREAPKSRVAESARLMLGDRAGARRRPPVSAYEPNRELLPADDHVGGYVVVSIALQDAAFRAVATRVADHHEATSLEFDGADFDALRERLHALRPKNVLFVVEPRTLDINMHRRLLLMSSSVDADIFADYAFGYLTARDGVALAALWDRIHALHRDGLPGKTWHSCGVATGIPSSRYAGAIEAHPKAAGFEGDLYYFASIEKQQDTLAAATKTLGAIAKASVITMSGCGDPQGTWLFSDRRNRDRSKHWRYEPDLVGQDPGGEMPRIQAPVFRALDLERPIVWSGVCHAGALRRVWVESDIVSTWGTVHRGTLHLQEVDQSIALALFDAGAAAFLGPLASNHGWSVSREVQFALREGASLGETLKSTYDDVYLAARGKLKLDFQRHGYRHADTENVMQGGGVNRVLYGDPALRPFARTPDPHESVEIVDRDENGFDVHVRWAGEQLHPCGWDIYGDDRARDWAVKARVDLEELMPPGGARVTASVVVRGVDGVRLPYVMKHAEPESYHGARYLHLQANASRKVAERKAVHAVFSVRW